MSGKEFKEPSRRRRLPATYRFVEYMMQRSLNSRRLVAFALVAAATAAPAIAAPLRAQQPTRTSSAANSQYRVIVQDLSNKTDAKSTRFGVKASELIRKGLSQMSTHTALAGKD